MSLPRGLTDQTTDRPTATARWGNSEEISGYLQHPGALLLGYSKVPHDSAGALIERLADLSKRTAEHPMARMQPEWASGNLRLLERVRDSLLTERLPVWFRDNRHLLTVAGSRSGKGTSAIIPNLCLYPGSCVVIDPKGENATVTASRRGQGSAFCEGMKQKVVVLDPFGVSKGTEVLRGKFNPLSLLDTADDTIVDKASSIADALLVRTSDRDAHWDDSARELIKAIILFVCSALDRPEDRTLLSVLKLLREGWAGEADKDVLVVDENTKKREPMRTLLQLMARVDLWDGAISGVAMSMLTIGEDEFGSILSTARRNLTFLEKPGMRRVLDATTFDIDDVKLAPEGMTIYLCLPPTRMVDCDRWLRLMIAVTFDRIYTVKMPARGAEPAPDDATGTGHAILFLLEEFPILGHMKIIETAAGFAAGYGLKLWLITQDLTQLKRHYREGWETFIGNAGLVQAFGNSDITTLEYLSKKLGETETLQHTVGTNASASWSSNNPSDYARASAWLAYGGLKTLLLPLIATASQQTTGVNNTTTTSTSPNLQRSPLARPDEIERLFRREELTQLIHIKGERPFFLFREEYFNTPEFLGKFEPDRGPRVSKEQAQLEAAAIYQARDRERAQALQAAAAFADNLERQLAVHEGKEKPA